MCAIYITMKMPHGDFHLAVFSASSTSKINTHLHVKKRTVGLSWGSK